MSLAGRAICREDGRLAGRDAASSLDRNRWETTYILEDVGAKGDHEEVRVEPAAAEVVGGEGEGVVVAQPAAEGRLSWRHAGGW